MKRFNVIKATGEKEAFDIAKLRRSMSNAGASASAIRKVTDHLKPHFREGVTTKELYSKAYELLKEYSKPTAGRYKLKEAIFELGPSGFPFEKFAGEILKRKGYRVEIGTICSGRCIDHETDILASNDHELIMVECKFHNRQDHHTPSSVALYVQARFNDLCEAWKSQPDLHQKHFKGWVITNTRFTSEAIRYAECAGLTLISWSFPQSRGLKEMIESVNLHPITCLSNLTRREKRKLLSADIIFCKQITEDDSILNKLQFNHAKRSMIIDEARNITENNT